MKNNYDKYMNEVWDAKEKLYKKFFKSGCKSFLEFIRNEIKSLKINYHSEKLSHGKSPVGFWASICNRTSFKPVQ